MFRRARLANYRKSYNGVWVRVMCPKCGAGGAQQISSCQPKCHKCNPDTITVLMEPASNDKIECTWKESVDYCKDYPDV
jgi:hypothetical protein